MKKRIISSIIIALIFVPVFLLGGLIFKLFCGVLGILAYNEIVSLPKFKKLPSIIKLLGVFSLILLMFVTNGYSIYLGVSYESLIITFITLFLPVLFVKKYDSDLALNLSSFTILLGLFLNSVLMINESNKWVLLYIVIVTCCTDVFAYLIGSIFGKHKFTPISPNKTLEGSVGGIVAATIAGTIYYLNVFPGSGIFKMLIISAFLALMSEVGDLIFSKIKRDNEIKDFSNLIPGHGGILDRLDSLMCCLLTYVLLCTLL